MTLYELIDHLTELAHLNKSGASTVASIVLALASKCAALEAVLQAKGEPSEDDVATEIKQATLASARALLEATRHDNPSH